MDNNWSLLVTILVAGWSALMFLRLVADAVLAVDRGHANRIRRKHRQLQLSQGEGDEDVVTLNKAA